MGGCDMKTSGLLSLRRQHLLSLLIVLAHPFLTSAAPNNAPASNVGRIFTFLIPGSGIDQANGPVLHVTAPLNTDDDREIRVLAQVAKTKFESSVYLSRGTTGTIRLPPTASGTKTGLQRGTVHVAASSPVAVQVVASGGSTSDAFLVLPEESLGMEYFASSTSPTDPDVQFHQSSLTITAVCDDTSVAVKSSGSITYLGVEYKKGRTARIKLDSRKSVQIQSSNGMTGTRVTSDKPISVLHGNTCPKHRDNCDFTVVQLSPIYALGKQFILARPGDSLESNFGEAIVMATRASTTVEISSLGLRRKIGRGEEWRVSMNQTDGPLYLATNKPVQVSLFLPGNSSSRRPYTMTVVPPVEQFLDLADFTVWSSSDVYPDGDLDWQQFQTSLTMLTTASCEDEASMPTITSNQSEAIKWTSEAIPDKADACVVRVLVRPGTFHLESQRGTDVRFAILLYAAGGDHAQATPVSFGGKHLRYISRESRMHQCLVESFNPCAVNPCRNSGDCIRKGRGYRCSCISPFYEGPLCEIEIDPCSLEEKFCLNGGTCNSHRSPLCSCPREWGGSLCEYDVNPKISPTNSTEFVITFMEHPIPRRSPSIIITTDANSLNATHVSVSMPAAGFTETLTILPNQAKVVSIPVEAISLGSRKQQSGVSIRASQKVTVTGFHNSLAPDDGFLALPVQDLGTMHNVITPRQRRKQTAEKSQFAVVAADDNTTVFIRTYVSVMFQGENYAAYSSIVTHLRRLEVVQFQSPLDLTRTEISSDRPVAVFSGSTCGYTLYEGNDHKSCSFMVEQLLPMRSWGKHFIAAPFLGNANGETTVRIVGGPKQTIVRGSHGQAAYLYDGSMQEMYITRPTYITTTAPVMVVAFSIKSKSRCSRKAPNCQLRSVPMMSIIPAINQVTTSAALITPSTSNTYSLRFKNYVNIITTDCSDIRISPQPGSDEDQPHWDANTNVRFTDLCVVSKELPPGKYRVSSKSGDVSFSAQQYGFNNHGTAYGYPITPSGNPAKDMTESTASSFGKEFVLTFISGGSYPPPRGPRVLITATTDAIKTEVSVTGADLDVTFELAPNEVKIVDVPASLIGTDGREPYPDIAIHVQSSHDVTVYGINDAYGYDGEIVYTRTPVSDGFLALPVSALATEYMLVTSWPEYQQYPDRHMQFVIIGLHDATRVDIKLRGAVFFDNYLNYGGTSMSIALRKHQVAYFKSFNDQTGTHIMSSKPVAVISGTDCGFTHRYPNDGPADFPCDHQVEFMLPVTRWGRTFLLAPLQGYRGGDVYVRIQAIHAYTNVKFGSGDSAREHSFQEFDSLSFAVGDQGTTNHTLIDSNLPVFVSAFTIYQPLLNCQNENGSCERYIKPVLFTVPPVETFKRRLIFPSYRIRGADDMTSYADIYTKCLEVYFLRINGNRRKLEYPLEKIPDTEYCVLRLQLTSEETVTSYVVESLLETGRLGVITYGFSSRSGYAFPGGL